MIYKFKSKATGDLIMLGPHGDQILRLAGREPGTGHLRCRPTCPHCWRPGRLPLQPTEARTAAPDDEHHDPVQLRQRLWPMIDMLRRAQQADEPVVWGV
jgi:hypothetical protein